MGAKSTFEGFDFEGFWDDREYSLIVEKVCGMPSARNNRIMIVDFLNRSCTFDARFRINIARSPAQNPFSTASAQGWRVGWRVRSVAIWGTPDVLPT